MIAALKRTPSWTIALALVILPLLFNAIRLWHTIPLAPGETIGPLDPDPWLRLTLVRDWMQGGSWYDHTMLRSNAPWGGIASPWTRPLDVVIRLITMAQPASVDLSVRLVRTALLLPALWMALLLMGIYRAVRSVTPLPAAPFMASALVACALTMWNYFSIANADHHAPMAVLFVWALGGVLHPSPSTRLQAVTGLLLGMLLWFSPEGLVLIGGIYAWYGILWLAGDHSAARKLSILATSTALMTLLAVLVERPPAAWFIPIYDSVSIVYVFLLALSALVAWSMALLPSPRLRTRLIHAGGACILALLAICQVYPLALHGPMATVDPYIFTNFLPRIVEAQPLYSKPMFYVMAMLLQPVLALAICVNSITRSDSIIPPKVAMQLGFCLLLTLALYVSQQRWYYYMYPVVAITIAPWLAALLTPLHPLAHGRWPAILMERLPEYEQMLQRLPIIAAILAVPVLLTYSAPSRSTNLSRSIDACYREARKMIYGGQLNQLNGGKPLTFFAPTDLGGEMLFWTPHRIVASNYHREGPGIRYVWEADAITSTEKLRRYFADRHISALMICPTVRPPKDSALQAIYAGKNLPDWLSTIPMQAAYTGNGPAIFMITNAAQ